MHSRVTIRHRFALHASHRSRDENRARAKSRSRVSLVYTMRRVARRTISIDDSCRSSSRFTPAAKTIRDLVARLQRRDPQALAELYDRYGRLTYSLILRVVRDARHRGRPGAGNFPARLESRAGLRRRRRAPSARGCWPSRAIARSITCAPPAAASATPSSSKRPTIPRSTPIWSATS